MTDEEKYPELAKVRKVKDKSHIIGEFLDNLGSMGYTLCTYSEGERVKWVDMETLICYDSLEDVPEGRLGYIEKENVGYPQGYHPALKPIQQILAEYFDIDYEKYQREYDERAKELLARHAT